MTGGLDVERFVDDVKRESTSSIASVVNPLRRLTGAIHISGGDFFAPGRSEWDAETLAERGASTR